LKPSQYNKQPAWVQWLAQDVGGRFEVEPLQNHHGWYENEVGQYIKIADAQANPQWKNSLIKVLQTFNDKTEQS